MYKIIYKDTIIDVVRNPKFVRFLSSGRIALTSKSTAQGIVGSDDKTIYSFTLVNRPDTKIATVEEISENEFSRLNSLLNSGKVVTNNETLLADTKNDVINHLSEDCKNKIIAGFSIKLSDGTKHTFRLTAEDQLNLLNLENQLNNGTVQTFVYHATGEPYRIFTRDDMTKIIRSYRMHVLYHTTYFNAAKQYIKSLTDIDKINSFSYGTDITYTVQDPDIRKILRDGGVN